MKRLLFTILTYSLIFNLTAQNSVSFYHLGNETYQHTNLNPAWIPSEGKWFIGLPGLSGVHVQYNNKLSYNELFTKEENQVTVDVKRAIPNMQNQNMASAHSSISLLHVGYRLKTGAVVSLFANERAEVDFLFPKQVVQAVWNGNSGLLNEEIKVGRAGFRANHFREIGLGYAFEYQEGINLGIRAKFLIGFLDVSTPGRSPVNITSNGEFFQIEGDLKNAQLRSSGLDIYEGNEGDLGSHLVMNGNNGFAFDLGFNRRLSKYYSISGSILDIGLISWKENIENDVLSDTTFTYNGVNLDGIGNLRQTLQDSLFSKFDTRKNFDTYSTWLPLRAYGSWTFHYTPRTDLYATVGTRILHGQIKMLYGGGLTHKFGKSFTASASAMKLPQQFFNLGAAFSVRGGPVQFYMAADQVINFSAPDLKAIDFRFGINFILRDKSGGAAASAAAKRGRIEGARGVDTNVFLGKPVKTKRRDGIYSVIKKQKKREIEQSEPKEKKKVVKGYGASGPVSDTKPVTKRSLKGRKGKNSATSKKQKVQKRSIKGRGAKAPTQQKKKVRKKSLNGHSAKGPSKQKKKVQRKSLTGKKF